MCFDASLINELLEKLGIVPDEHRKHPDYAQWPRLDTSIYDPPGDEENDPELEDLKFTNPYDKTLVITAEKVEGTEDTFRFALLLSEVVVEGL